MSSFLGETFLKGFGNLEFSFLDVYWPVVIVVVLGIAPFVWLLSWNTAYVRAVEAIPGPKCRLLFGNAFDLLVPNEEIYMALCGLIQKHPAEPVVRLWLGNHAYAVVKKAESIEAILSSAIHITKSDDYGFFHNWLGLGLLTSGVKPGPLQDALGIAGLALLQNMTPVPINASHFRLRKLHTTGQRWHEHRKLLAPSFHFSILEQFICVFNEQSDTLMEKLKQHAGAGQFDIYPYVVLCTLDIICETAMGKNLNAQDNKESEYVKAISDMGRIFFMRMTRPWLKSDWIYKLSSLYCLERRSLKILHSFTDKVIKDRQELLAYSCSTTMGGVGEVGEEEIVVGRKRRLVFLDMLLHAATSEGKLSLADVREEVDTFMFAGHDTTTSGLSWTLYLLGHHCDVQEKVQEELDIIFAVNDKPVTTAVLNKMKYLEAVIKESLRLYPSVPMFGRHLKEDAVVAGCKIPAGTNIIVDVSDAHRDPDVFPDPERFDPTRFLHEPGSTRHAYAHIPFSAGPRNCIGQKFALMEMKVVLAKFLRTFNITSHVKMNDIKYFTQPVLRPTYGIRVSIILRNKTNVIAQHSVISA